MGRKADPALSPSQGVICRFLQPTISGSRGLETRLADILITHLENLCHYSRLPLKLFPSFSTLPCSVGIRDHPRSWLLTPSDDPIAGLDTVFPEVLCFCEESPHSEHIRASFPPRPALGNTEEAAEGCCVPHQQSSHAPAWSSTRLLLLRMVLQSCDTGVRLDTIKPISISFLDVRSSARFLLPIPTSTRLWRLFPAPHRTVWLQDPFFGKSALAVTPSVISDNSSFLKGYIKLLQGRHFYVLFLMLLRTGFMSKNSSVTSSSCSIILTKISHCESPWCQRFHQSKAVNTAAVSLSSVLVTLPEISLTPSTLLCCQKNFICGVSLSFHCPFYFSLLPFSFSSLPKEMRGKHKRDTVPSLSLHHLQMVSFSWQFHMQPYKKTWLAYAANFKDGQSCVGPLCAAGVMVRGWGWFLWESVSVANG